MMRVIKITYVGQIDLIDEVEVARINAERRVKCGGVKKCDRHPTLNVQVYKGKPKGEVRVLPRVPVR